MAQKLKTTVTIRDLMTQNPITLDRNETLDLVESIMNRLRRPAKFRLPVCLIIL